MEHVTKFVNWETPKLINLKDTNAYKLRDKLNNNIKLNKAEKEFITEQVNHNIYFRYAIPCLGWKFDFSDVLKTYVVKQYGHWTEYRGFDKRGLRKTIHGEIDKIVEVI